MAKKKTVVIALGHRALGRTLPEQKTATRQAAKAVADLVELGHNVVVCHSNSSQVSMIHMAMGEFAVNHREYTKCPMSVCSAMSQGYIGYDLQNSVRAELITRGIQKPVSTILTQVLVDPYDEAFYEPSKIIGRVLSREEAEEEELRGNHVVQTKEGYRRIVASPVPREIIEIESIKALLEADQVVICCGGGGIPVIIQDGALQGASAVIEKDDIAGKLASDLSADVLLILTSVPYVFTDFGKESQKPIRSMNIRQATEYSAQGQFGQTDMLPKINAAITYLNSCRNGRVIITMADQVMAALDGKSGTQITA